MKKIGLALAATAAALFVAGCATQGTDSGSNVSAQPAVAAQPVASCKGKSSCKGKAASKAAAKKASKSKSSN